MTRTYHKRGVTVHGFAVRSHPIYVTWVDMMSRCYNEKSKSFENYGGRGIRVDPSWHHFVNFANDMWPKPDQNLTLERTDNNAGYSKANCIWATRTAQCLNRRMLKNNTSSFTGVVPVKVESGVRYEARFTVGGVRYVMGRFDTAQEATTEREWFVDLYNVSPAFAISTLPDQTLWCTSSTLVRGVTPHADGGYVARCTIEKKRHYVGYFSSIEAAQNARLSFIEKETGRSKA